MENMLNHNELRKGVRFLYQNQPYEVIEYNLSFKGRGSSVTQAKIRNLITGNVTSKTFHTSDSFKEVEIEKTSLKFIYKHKDKIVFSKENNERIELENIETKFLKPNLEVEGLVFNDEIINIVLPVKVSYKVTEAPPGLKGGRSESGTKQVTIESGAIVSTPLFVEQGDTIEVNTETGEYTRRIE